jgi:hypothetical protein
MWKNLPMHFFEDICSQLASIRSDVIVQQNDTWQLFNNNFSFFNKMQGLLFSKQVKIIRGITVRRFLKKIGQENTVTVPKVGGHYFTGWTLNLLLKLLKLVTSLKNPGFLIRRILHSVLEVFAKYHLAWHLR